MHPCKTSTVFYCVSARLSYPWNIFSSAAVQIPLVPLVRHSFCFHIEYYRNAQARTAKDGRCLASKRILVVEDDVVLLQTLAEALRAEGYLVDTAQNGVEGLHRLTTAVFPPSLVVVDMYMPVLAGPDFVEMLRARGFTVPVIVMSAAQDAALWAREIGADGFLIKPFELPDLTRCVTEATHTS
jgi:CheY-like chemotaxis protein